MKTALDIFIILLLFGAFAAAHSFLATDYVKKNISLRAGNKAAFYRIFYNAFSVITFAALLEVTPKPDQLVYELRYPWDIIFFALQALSLAGAVWSFASMDFYELSGLNNVKRYFRGTFNPENPEEGMRLSIKGPHKISRHPAYFFIILFLAFRAYMNLFFLVFFVCCTAYFFIGAYFEEKKLIRRFGNEYIEYAKRTSKIFPFKFSKMM